MAAEELTYAKVGGPPEEWMGLKVLDVTTGQELRDVLEVNTVEGWCVTLQRDARDHLVVAWIDGTPEPAQVRIEGVFKIIQPNLH